MAKKKEKFTTDELIERALKKIQGLSAEGFSKRLKAAEQGDIAKLLRRFYRGF